VAVTGIAKGIMIWKKTRVNPAPSTTAASSSSFGSEEK